MIKFFRENAEKIISVSICVLVIFCIGFYVISLENKAGVNIGVDKALEKIDDEENTITVFVDGEVVSPGEYVLKEGARVGDAIEMAGGFTEKANTKINIAYALSDGAKVTVVDKSKNANSGIDYRVNINTADKDELMRIEGIGEVTAENIINYRESAGGFKNKEDFLRVKGIGEKLFEKVKDIIVVE